MLKINQMTCIKLFRNKDIYFKKSRFRQSIHLEKQEYVDSCEAHDI